MILRRVVQYSIVCLALLATAACTVRSISDSGYRDDYGRGAYNPFYKGEVSEFEVLGIDPAQKVTDADIQKAFDGKQPMSITSGASILLVQSGATAPDPEMVKALEKHYSVAVFTGVPAQPAIPTANAPGAPYAMLLRLAAAKGGYETIVAYWGVLESAREGLGTKAISWVPLIGGAIPDENQHMRIRLKIAVINVKTGQWEMFVPDSFDDESLSGHFRREASDQEQVQLLKAKAYQVASDEIVKRYAH